MINTADHILDLTLNPDGGVRGGAPEEVAAVKGSYTGQYLKPMLERQAEAAE